MYWFHLNNKIKTIYTCNFLKLFIAYVHVVKYKIGWSTMILKFLCTTKLHIMNWAESPQRSTVQNIHSYSICCTFHIQPMCLTLWATTSGHLEGCDLIPKTKKLNNVMEIFIMQHSCPVSGSSTKGYNLANISYTLTVFPSCDGCLVAPKIQGLEWRRRVSLVQKNPDFCRGLLGPIQI